MCTTKAEQKQVFWTKAASCYLSWGTGSPSLRAEMGSHLNNILKCLWVCITFSSDVQTSRTEHFKKHMIMSLLFYLHSPPLKADVLAMWAGTAEQGSRHGLSHIAVHPRCLCRSCSSHLPSFHAQNPALRGAMKIHRLPTRACNEQAAPSDCSSFMCDRWTSYHESDFIFIKYFPVW